MALKFEITGDNSNLLSSLDGAREGVRSAARDIEESGMGIEDMFKRIGAAAGIAFSLDQAKSFIGKIAEVRAYFQDIESTMEVFLGNQQKAAQFTEELKDYAYYNMFDFAQLADASKQMIAYGNAVEDVIPRLDQLSNIATGTKADLMELVNLYNRAKNLGEIGSQGLASWATKGLVVKDVLKDMGIECDGTKVTFEQLNMVLDKVTGEGGMFHDLMLNQMENISAEQGQLQDNLDAMYNEIGEKYQDFITGTIKAESWLVDHYKEVGSVILGLVAAYGEYQAALRVTRAIEKTMTKQANEIEAQRQAELQSVYAKFSTDEEVVAEEASTAAIVQNTASREGNVTAIDSQIAALERKMLAEIEEQNGVYQAAKEALSVLKEQEAQKDSEINTLKEQISTAQEYIESEKEAMESALNLGNAEEAETIKTNIATESKRLETLQEELGAAQKEKNIIADQKHSAVISTKTALERKQTMQQKLTNMQQAVNIAQTKAQTAATGLWTAMINGAKNALNSLKLAMASNPFGLALAAITTIISLLPIFSEETSQASAEVERFGENAVKQTRNLETLMAVVDNTSKDSKVHKDAVDELCDIYEEYGFKIDDEIDKLQQLKDMHDLVTDAIHKEGEERQKANLLQSYNEALEEATTNMRDALQNAFENAEWDASGWIDDWDAEEYQEKAKELTHIIGAIIQSEGDALATLTGDELETKIQEVNARIEKAYTDMGLSLSKQFLKGDYVVDSPVDVDVIQIMRDYADATHSVTDGRKKLIESFEQGKKSAAEETKEIDYSAMSIADLAKEASKASDNVSDLGNQSASPTVDKTSIEDANDASTTAKTGIDLLNGATAKPMIDTTSINFGIQQTNTLLGNMFQLQNFGMGGGKSSFSLGFNPNKFGFGQTGQFNLFGGKKPVWGTIGGKSGVQWMPDIPITDPKLLAQNELNNRVNGANTQKKVDDLLKDVNDALSKAVFDSDEYKSLESLKKRLEAKSRKGHKSSNGKKNNTAEKLASEIDKLDEMMDDLEFERIRETQDMQTRITDARLELMESGAEKVRRLQEQQNKEEIEFIERQREDAIRKYIEEEKKVFDQQEKIKKTRNDKYKVKKFDESTVDTSEIAKQYDEIISLAKQKQAQDSYQQTLRSMRDYLKEYGTLEQQRFAITQEYEEKIANAMSPTERASIMLDRNKALEDFDAKQFEEQIDWTGIFSDLEGHTQEYLIGLRDQLQGVLNEGNLTPEQMSVVQEKLRDINSEISKQNGLFQFQGDRAREHTRLVQEAADAQDRLTQAKEDEANAQQNVLDITEQIRDMLEGVGIDRDVDIDDELLSQFDANSEEYKQMAKLLETLRVGEGKLAKARRDTASATNKAKNAEDAKKRDASQAVADWFSDAQQFITEKGLDQIPALLDELGLGDASQKVSQGLSGFNNAAGAAADFASGNYIGAAVKGISAVKDFGRMFGIGGGNEKEVAETTERLTKANEILSDRIADLTDAMGNSAGAKAIYAYETALKAQEEVNKNQMEILKAQMGYHSAHHSNNYYASDSTIRSYNSDAQRAFQAAGVQASTITGLSSIYNLTPEQLKAIKDFSPDLWKYLTEVGKYDKSEYWEAVVENAGKTEELTKQINDNLTQTSFDDLRSSYLDALTDMESDSEDFAKSFEDMMFKAMLNSIVLNDEFDDWLQDWQKRYAQAVKNNDQRELERLREEAVNKRDQKVSERDQLADTMNYSGGSAYKQEASSKGFQAMSQDTGNELNGRFTAVQIAAENIGVQVISIYSQMLLMAQTQTSSNTYLMEIRNMMITGTSYLEDIAKYSKKIYNDFATKLDDITTNTK